jgi:hypothetical protein
VNVDLLPAAGAGEQTDHDRLLTLEVKVKNLEEWVKSIDLRLWAIVFSSFGALVLQLWHK